MLGITEVIENLYLSGHESRQAILNKGIRCVINISSECPVQDLGPHVEYEKISLPDLPTASIQPYFNRLTDRIHQNLQQGKKTLVHCYVGRSRSATIILAYLMKYKQMTLRDAFHYLRSRRHIIGPNFGFIKQLITFEKSLFGYTSVSFVNTSFGSVPDIYLTGPSSSRSRRQPTNSTTTHIPIQITNPRFNKTQSPPPVVNKSTTTNATSSPVRSSFLYSSSLPRYSNHSGHHSTTNALPARAATTVVSPTHGYSHATTGRAHRPVSSSFVFQHRNPTTELQGPVHRTIVQQAPEPSRMHTMPVRSSDAARDFVVPNKNSSFRTMKYVPSAYNRYH